MLIFLLAFCAIFCDHCFSKEDMRITKPSEPKDAPPKNPLSRGWNDDISWVNIEDGLKIAKERNKPAFVLIHKTWCHACQSLKKTFSKAKKIQEMSKHFVMVNCEDDEEPWEEQFSPDGGKYIPRLFFVDPDGQVLKDVKNPKEEFKEYPYYYSNPAPIITAMKQVMSKYNLSEPEELAEKHVTSGKKIESEKKPIAAEKKSKDFEKKGDKKKKSEL